MKKRWLLGLGSLLSSALWAASPVGVWQTFDEDSGEKKSEVEIIELSSGELAGKILLLNQKPGALCVECKGSKKDQPIEGMTVIWGLQPDGENEWTDGEVLDPANGKTYNLKIELSEDGNTMDLRGYVGVSLLGRTQTWKRIK
ncbi:DUF2147 domain-containing protein [Suttonella sp. R2A3]|uniref:DUF2147 domain-containing protein n=1 Tax=Suttonella sp. R2A3 TaxID=2908648 RepID=UPI001F4418ED|nr:DUF2147 domain-containing protein [Suttonella sp. R2A3]UJF24670.1 DUF2147 domain-containing protein [Suttonella sp. R2A3]